MKRILFLALCICTSFVTRAQQTSSVEQSTFGLQIGTYGLWAYNELRLSDQIAFRSEIGYASRSEFLFPPSGDLPFAPVFTAEPRWYYNLKKRARKGKDVTGNSADYIAFRTSYRSDLFQVTGDDYYGSTGDLYVLPTWAIRRNIGKRFSFETGLGLGYRYTIDEGPNFTGDRGSIVTDFRFRLGYRF